MDSIERSKSNVNTRNVNNIDSLELQKSTSVAPSARGYSGMSVRAFGSKTNSLDTTMATKPTQMKKKDHPFITLIKSMIKRKYLMEK
jgi:hypothetical protein